MKDDDNDDNGVDNLDFTEDTIDAPIEEIAIFEDVHYEPDEKDLTLLDKLYKRYPKQSLLDVVHSLDYLANGREDKKYIEELLEKMGLVEIT